MTIQTKKRKASLIEPDTKIDTVRISFNPSKIGDIDDHTNTYSDDKLRKITQYLENINNYLVKVHNGKMSISDAADEFVKDHVDNTHSRNSFRNVIAALSKYKFFLRPTLDWIHNPINREEYTMLSNSTKHSAQDLAGNPERLKQYIQEYYNKSADGLKKYFDKDVICGTLDNEYVEDSIQNCDALLEVIGNIQGTPTIMGIAVLVFDIDNDTLFIDILCANVNVSGVGSEILKYLDALGGYLDLRGINMNTITLNSLTDAVGFYMKTKFTCYDKETKDDTCSMRREISTLFRKKKITRKKTTPYNIRHKSRSRSRSMSMKKTKTRKTKTKTKQ